MIIAGVDEVGRGCLAGPVTAAAVILNNPILELKDSNQIVEVQLGKIDKGLNKIKTLTKMGKQTREEYEEKTPEDKEKTPKDAQPMPSPSPEDDEDENQQMY